MATIEERLATLEQGHAELKHDNAELKHDNAELKHDNTELKQKIELQTIAIGGLVSKALLERLNEKNDKIFKVLSDHDKLTNLQLAELREKIEVQVEGKIAGLQTEMRQGFERTNARFGAIDGRLDAMDTRFDAMDTRLDGIDTRLGQILLALAALAPKPDQKA